MSEIIIEIVIGALILMLAGMMIIPLYNQSQAIINGILYSGASDSLEKSLFGLDDESFYSGAEVIAQIDYFSVHEKRIITVIDVSHLQSYLDEKYDPVFFHISLHDLYTLTKKSGGGYVEYTYTIKTN